MLRALFHGPATSADTRAADLSDTKLLKRVIHAITAIALTMLVSTLGLSLAPAPAVLADDDDDDNPPLIVGESMYAEAVGVVYSHSPNGNRSPHNGVALTQLRPGSQGTLLIKHVGDPHQHPLCYEILAFYSTQYLKTHSWPPKKLPKGVKKGHAFIRWQSVPYQGTPIVYRIPKQGQKDGDVKNAVFSWFETKDKKIIKDAKAAANLKPNVLQAGTLYIDHFNRDKSQSGFGWEHKAVKHVFRIRLMKDITTLCH